jgi:hypothetical protein
LWLGTSIHSVFEWITKTNPSEEKIRTYTSYAWSEQDNEDKALLNGLAWVYYLYGLPNILADYEVVGVEQELQTPFQFPNHNTHLVLESRPDLILRDKVTKKYSIHDFKSVSTLSDWSIGGWKTSLQMALCADAASKKYGVPIESYFIHAIGKGQKKNGERRKSPLCYIYSATESGAITPKPPNVHWDALGPVSAPEVAARALTPAQIKQIYNIVGPFPVNHTIVEQFAIAAPIHEEGWQRLEDHLSGIQLKYGWASFEYQKTLSMIPRSYNCEQYNERCVFWNICMQEPGWAQPLKNSYKRRTPHHPETASLAGESE